MDVGYKNRMQVEGAAVGQKKWNAESRVQEWDAGCRCWIQDGDVGYQ